MIALTNARLVDGTGGPAQDGMTVVIDGGRITAIGDTPPPTDAAMVDLEGRTLMPGLIDAHVHLSSLDRSLGPELHPFGLVQAGQQMLDGGVTTVRDVGSYGRSLFDLRNGDRAGRRARPAARALRPDRGCKFARRPRVSRHVPRSRRPR